MAGMYGLGRVYNLVPIAAAKTVSMKGATGVAFVCQGADTFTLKTASSAGGSATALAKITQYYTNAQTDGTGTWTYHTQAAGSTVTQAAGVSVFEVLASQLADPSDYVEVTVAASGTVVAIPFDLTVQRKPANLVALNA